MEHKEAHVSTLSAKNVEVKASVEGVEGGLEGVEQRARALCPADAHPHHLHQHDTFFVAAHGRLKLRVVDRAKSGLLIHYERADQTGPKSNDWVLTEVADADGVRGILKAAYGVRGVVEKSRTVYVVDQTRIHLDRVTGLGDFMELEVVLREGQSVEEGAATAHHLLRQLGVPQTALLDKSYVDMLIHD